MAPIVTVIGLQFGYLLGGVIVIEYLFGLPGLGQLIVNSINTRDYTVVQAGVLVVATLFILVTLLADLAAAWLDPRSWTRNADMAVIDPALLRANVPSVRAERTKRVAGWFGGPAGLVGVGLLTHAGRPGTRGPLLTGYSAVAINPLSVMHSPTRPTFSVLTTWDETYSRGLCTACAHR